MNYRVVVQRRRVDFLVPVRNKMKEIILIERTRENEVSDTQAPVGYINPKECDAIQQFRIRMRRFGLKKRTESSYVCLLYTSPSPRDRQKSRMPSSA